MNSICKKKKERWLAIIGTILLSGLAYSFNPIIKNSPPGHMIVGIYAAILCSLFFFFVQTLVIIVGLLAGVILYAQGWEKIGQTLIGIVGLYIIFLIFAMIF